MTTCGPWPCWWQVAAKVGWGSPTAPAGTRHLGGPSDSAAAPHGTSAPQDSPAHPPPPRSLLLHHCSSPRPPLLNDSGRGAQLVLAPQLSPSETPALLYLHPQALCDALLLTCECPPIASSAAILPHCLLEMVSRTCCMPGAHELGNLSMGRCGQAGQCVSGFCQLGKV